MVVFRYVLLLAWVLVLFCCIIVTTFTSLSWGKFQGSVIRLSTNTVLPGVCSTEEVEWNRGSIDFYPFHFMFPEGSQKVNMLVEGELEIKQFCIDFVQNAEMMFLMATAACVLVIFSLVHFLMALSANYAHIRGHDKFTDLVVSSDPASHHYYQSSH